MKLFNRKKNEKKSTQPALPEGQRSTQSWLPIADVTNRMIYRRDNHIVTGIRIQPVNIHLLSDKEKALKISSLHEVINGIDYPLQIETIARPVDLDGYIARLTHRRDEETHFLKRRLLDGYIRQAAILATGGEALERQFYIFLNQPLGKKPQQDHDELMGRTMELASNLTGAGLTANVCTDQELRDVLFIFLNPQQAAYERSPQSSDEMISAIYEGV